MKNSKAFDKPSTSQDKAVELPKGGYNVSLLESSPVGCSLVGFRWLKPLKTRDSRICVPFLVLGSSLVKG